MNPSAVLEAMRPHQWVKNLLVFASVVFAHRLGDPTAWRDAGLAFATFCALASAVYLFNDVLDRHADAAHPKKRTRPIPSGRLSVPLALGTSAALVTIAAAIGLSLGTSFLVWPFVYAGMNLAYSLRLKREPILDCLIVAAGFGIRVHAGSTAIDEPSSSWLLLCTFFFALFLAFCKRRDELANVVESDQGAAKAPTRASLRALTLPFLDQIIAPLAALSILSYALYTVAPQTIEAHGEEGSRRLVFTVPFVVFGVFRYLLLVHTRSEGSDPARLLFRDPPILIAGLLWAAAILWAIGPGAFTG
jgi:4-hydroxybenzoate polyprenyltransferase